MGTRSEYLKAWVKKRIAEGFCPHCGNPLEPGYKRCSACRAKSLTKYKKWKAAKRSSGLCCQCGVTPTNNGEFYCESCKRRRYVARDEAARKLKAAGICALCKTNPVGPTSTRVCEACYPRVLEGHRREVNRANFGGNRPAALERDGHKCYVCGTDKKLEVHHLDFDRSNTSLDNLMTLCAACHACVTILSNSANPDLVYSIVKEQKRV